MANRISALAGHYTPGKFGLLGNGEKTGVKLEDVKDLVLHQIAVWPESLDAVAAQISQSAGSNDAPGPGQSTTGSQGALLRVEPLKWWLIGASAPELDAELGATLDISHSRTQIRVSGEDASEFLNRHLSLDLREHSFPVGSVASTAIHHVGITLWHSSEGYELFIPRGFALSLWEGFVESAEQFGLEVV